MLEVYGYEFQAVSESAMMSEYSVAPFPVTNKSEFFRWLQSFFAEYLLSLRPIEDMVGESFDDPDDPANGDGTINVGDAVYVINYVFKNGPQPTPWTKCNGDANGDCACNVGDAVYIINYVFKNGPAPVTLPGYETECLPDCGDYVGP